MNEIRLGVNIDHIATLRNARGENDPSLLEMGFEVIDGGADSLTMHLREDRRHIRDEDVHEIMKHSKVPLNLEMAVTDEMIRFALSLRPKSVCLVPERREEITTEGGLDVSSMSSKIKDAVRLFRAEDIEVFLFVEPDPETLKISADTQANGVELHTGSYARNFQHEAARQRELHRLENAARDAKSLGIELHAGHGLNYANTVSMKHIEGLTEVNTGHAIISRALKTGLSHAVSDMKELLR